MEKGGENATEDALGTNRFSPPTALIVVTLGSVAIVEFAR